MMKISNDKLKEFECATSVDKHFLERPVALSCGHNVCKNCIPKVNFTHIKCNICDKLTTKDIRNDEESVLSKKAFQLSIDELYSQLYKSFNLSMKHLNGISKFIYLF